MIAIAYDVEIADFTPLKLSVESKELKFIAVEDIKNINIAETHIPCVNFLLRQT